MSRRGGRILYLTSDGILSPLGHSQVVRPVLGLAARGHRYHLVSLEREGDLADDGAVDAMRRRLAEAGVGWTHGLYAQGGARAAAASQARLTALAHREARRGEVALVHARSYLPAVVADTLRAAHGLPFLFDMRGYWIDERLEDGRWFTHPLALRAARRVERRLYRRCAGVVSLTRVGEEDVRAGAFGPWPADKPAATIPTCVDYDEFVLPEGGTRLPAPEPLRDALEGRTIVAFVGSINRSYLVSESLRLVRRAMDLRGDVHLLCLTRQLAEVAAAADVAGIPAHRRTILSVGHDEVARWLASVHYGLLLLDTTRAKRASMPTKLAEFFATGVRPIQLGCNADVDHWTEKAGSAIRLGGASEAHLEEAARRIAAEGPRPPDLVRAREATRAHFALDSGVERYDTLLRDLLR